MSTYEEPTNELRQVKKPIFNYRPSDIGRGSHDLIGHDLTVQRKWIIHEVDDKGFRFTRGAKEEWRNLPVVDSEDAL